MSLLTDIEDIKTITISKYLGSNSTSAVGATGFNSPFTVNLNNINFVPDYAIVHSIVPTWAITSNTGATQYQTSNYTPAQPLILWSDLIGDSIGTFSDKPLFPQSLLILKKPVSQLNFQVLQSNTSSDGYNFGGFSPAQMPPIIPNSNTTLSLYLGLTLDFIKLKKHK